MSEGRLSEENSFLAMKELSHDVLRDKIKGGWAGQTIWCTYGGPTEFCFRSQRIPDDYEIPWYAGYLKETYDTRPGLYDDIYMDLTFVKIFEQEGLNAPAQSFAKALAYFAGLMSPGMVNTAAEICDTIGHIMNYGDGWYGGVYVAAMYTRAFISDDLNYIVEEALKVIPAESQYAQCMQDVIHWHQEYPDNWKHTWQQVHDRWNDDVGCPRGVFDDFNIDAKINSAWVLTGLLYGEKDFGKTIDISTRCGDDSDCNPANAGGILGTMLGYRQIPEYWKQGLAEVEPINFKHTTISLNRVYDMSYQQALNVIKKNGGVITEDTVMINVQKPKPVRLEVGFEGHHPVERRAFNLELTDEISFTFDGIGFAVNGAAEATDTGSRKRKYVFEVEMSIDGELVQTSTLPINNITRKFIPFWKYQLPRGIHTVQLKVLNPTKIASIRLSHAIFYAD
jgi:hypothetical protein